MSMDTKEYPLNFTFRRPLILERERTQLPLKESRSMTTNIEVRWTGEEVELEFKVISLEGGSKRKLG